MNMVQ